MIRYAVAKREALGVELENFRDAVLQKPADIVTLRQGVDTLEVADAILAASRDCAAVTLDTGEPGLPDQPAAWHRRRHAGGDEVTGEQRDGGGARQDRPAACRADSRQGFRVRGADRSPEVVRSSRGGSVPFPASPAWPSGWRGGRGGAAHRHIRHDSGAWRKATWSSSSCR